MNCRERTSGFLVLLPVFLMGCGELPESTGNKLGPYVIGQVPPNPRDDMVEIRKAVDENGDSLDLITDFVDGSEIVVEIYNGKVWRISVLTPGATFSDGIQVGEKVSKVLARDRKAKIEIAPGPSLVILPESSCGISYFTDVPSENISFKESDMDALSSLAKEATIKTILLVGCDA